MGHFLSDLDKSQGAVEVVRQHFEDRGYTVRELEKKEQKKGDLEISDKSETFYVEVKYDLYAKRSGNLCFEMSNGKRMTGIMETEADYVYYVVPGNKVKTVFVFNTEKLRAYIQDPLNVTMKKGGDGRRFDLALVKIQDVVANTVASEFFSVAD